MGHTLSHGTLGVPRPKPIGSPPPIPSAYTSEYDTHTHNTTTTEEDDSNTHQTKSLPTPTPPPTQSNQIEDDNQSLAQQLKEVKDRLTRQVHEITILRRELDDKYRLEIELKTDLEAERSKAKEVKSKPPPPEGKKPQPPAVPPPPQNIQPTHSGTNLSGMSTNQLNNQILELKATITILEKENLMIREDLDKTTKKKK